MTLTVSLPIWRPTSCANATSALMKPVLNKAWRSNAPAPVKRVNLALIITNWFKLTVPLNFWGMTKQNTAALSPIYTLRANLLNNCRKAMKGSSYYRQRLFMLKAVVKRVNWVTSKPKPAYLKSKTPKNLVKPSSIMAWSKWAVSARVSQAKHASQAKYAPWVPKTTPPLTYCMPPFVSILAQASPKKGHWSIVRCCVLTSRMTKPWLSKTLSPLKTSLTNKSLPTNLPL